MNCSHRYIQTNESNVFANAVNECTNNDTDIVKTYGKTKSSITEDSGDDLSSCSYSLVRKSKLPLKTRVAVYSSTNTSSVDLDEEEEISDLNDSDDESGDCVFMSEGSSDCDDKFRSSDDDFIKDGDTISENNTINDSLSSRSSTHSYKWEKELELVGGWPKFMNAHMRGHM